jgi:ribonuclease VapC
VKKDAKAVLDASAVLAVVQDEPGADALRPLLPRALVCSVNLAEVLAKLVRDGMPRQEAAAALDALHIEEVAFDAADAQRSAAYVTKGVSLGDRCFLAAAARYGEGFTSDRQLSQCVTGAPALHNFR